VKWTKAKDLMTTDVKTVSADWPLNRVAEYFVAHDISGAPVVDDDDELVGVISLTDLARHNSMARHQTASDRPPAYYQSEPEGYAPEDMSALNIAQDDTTTAGDAMTPKVYNVNEHTSVQQVADVMLRGRIQRVFVTERGEIRGIITALDMLQIIREL
jgi:CBS domain-containing protein